MRPPPRRAWGSTPAVLLRRLSGYSRGMLQRIGVAQAMLRDPPLLFLDEPASGTDPLGVAVVRDRILEAKARGATIVLNSHQLPEVERVCDRVVFIDGGRADAGPDAAGRHARAAARDRCACRRTGRGRGAPRRSPASRFPRSPRPTARSACRSRARTTSRRAVKALALADVPVLEARSSADLEEMFRKGRVVIEMVRRFLRQKFGSPAMATALGVLALLTAVPGRDVGPGARLRDRLRGDRPARGGVRVARRVREAPSR